MDEQGEAREESREIVRLRERTQDRPEDVKAWFALGSELDSNGFEAEAMEAYERVLALGFERLPNARQPELFLQAGSTLRNLGRLDDARALLERGRTRWPEFRALTAFLSLVELSAGNDRHAALLLLADAAAEHEPDGSLMRYGRSLRAYTAELDRG